MLCCWHWQCNCTCCTLHYCYMPFMLLPLHVLVIVAASSISLQCAHWSVLVAHCFLGCRAVLFVFTLVLLLLLSVVWALLPCMCCCVCAFVFSRTWMPPCRFGATPSLLSRRAHFIGVNNANNTHVHSACWHSSWLADTFLLLICVRASFHGLSTRTFALFFVCFVAKFVRKKRAKICANKFESFRLNFWFLLLLLLNCRWHYKQLRYVVAAAVRLRCGLCGFQVNKFCSWW